MSTQETPEQTSAPSVPSAMSGVASDAPHTTQAASPPSPPSHNGSDAADNDAGDENDSGDEGSSEGSPSDGPSAVAGAPGTGKRKRRRRKKKAHGEGVAVASDGLPSPEGENKGENGTDHPRPQSHEAGAPRTGKRGKGRDRARRAENAAGPARERPPFNLGDVVFGKIVALTDDAIFVDLSGKANAIFDRLELDMPEEPANTPATPEEEEDAPGTIVVPKALLAREKAAHEAASQAASAEIVVATSVTAEALGEHAADAKVAPEAQATTGDDQTAAVPAAPDPPAFLPPVVLEVGANFVGVVHNDGARGGLVVLTRHPRRGSRVKPAVLAAFKDKDTATVMGLITGVIRGGVEVDIEGLRAFAPGSHMDLRLGTDLHHKVGMRLPFSVTQYGKKGRDVVLSRRRMLESEAKSTREAALAKLAMGTIVDGIVRSIVPFGAFIDVGGVEGLVPLQEMSHNRGDGPQDCFKVGETTKVKIVRLDEKGKLWLSRKATIEDPWAAVAKKYSVGTRHPGKIVRLQPFGVFVELETGIDGLIHCADLSLKRFEHPSEVVKVGDELEVVVASVDGTAHKIALHPALTGAAAEEPHQKVQLHKALKVCVVLIDPGGLVVRVLGATGRHARGFIPAGATGTARGTELRKVFPVGKELEAKVIDMDPKRGEVKLSIKAMNEDTERNAYKAYQQQVKREAKFGTFGDLLAKKMQKD